MAAKDSAIGVQLIDDDVAQVLEQAHPFGVVRQNASVQHVRIGQDDVPTLADRLARIARGVAIIGEHTEAVIEPGAQIVQLRQLVLGEGFRRKQIQRAGVGILQHLIQHRQVVAESLSRSRRRDHDDVLAVMHKFGCGGLVRIQLLDPLDRIRFAQFRAHPLGKGAERRLAGRNLAHAGQHLIRVVASSQGSENLTNHIKSCAGSWCQGFARRGHASYSGAQDSPFIRFQPSTCFQAMQYL